MNQEEKTLDECCSFEHDWKNFPKPYLEIDSTDEGYFGFQLPGHLW